MGGLTLQQLQQMGGTPITPPPIQPSGQGLSLSQIQQMGGQPATSNSLLTPAKESLQGLGELYGGGEKGIANKLKTDITDSASDIQKGDVKGVAKAALRTAGDVAETVYAPVGAALQATGINKVFDFIGKISQMGGKYNPINAITDIKSVQDFVTQHPNLDQDFGRAMSLTMSAFDKGQIKPEDVIPRTLEQVKTIADNAKGAAATLNPLNVIKSTGSSPEDIQTQLQGVSEDWTKPTTINEPKYNNARAVLEKDPNVPQTLAQNGINPFSNIEDGKYNTEDTAQKLRDDNGKLSRDLLRPSLQMADYSVPPTPIAEIKPIIDTSQGNLADEEEAINAKVASKLDALTRRYPAGMSLTDILDEKILYDSKGGYKEYKSDADNINAVSNRAIADSLRSILATKGEAAGVPVSDFQAELTKNYRAADYLDALHGKKAPVSPLQSAVRYGAKVLGAKTAGMVGGSDLVSEFVGYHIGGALEKFVENMTNPMRDSFLQNLKITNPPAFVKMEEYLKNNQK